MYNKRSNICKKFNLKYSSYPDKAFVEKQLKEGTRVELKEHTDIKCLAKQIAKSHIVETGYKTKEGKISSKYYPELKKLEKKLKNEI